MSRRQGFASKPFRRLCIPEGGYEDGDYATLRVNGRVYLSNMMLRNAGYPVLVDVKPGANLVEIYGETASFYIIRR
jgi:hypothetical protein